MEGVYAIFEQYANFGARRGEAPKEPELTTSLYTKVRQACLRWYLFISSLSLLVFASNFAVRGKKKEKALRPW